jgi:hypothetical protein
MSATETPREREWLTAADTAKLVRQALKRAFPNVKFSVRSDTYAGGASVRVRWTDGPTTSQVDEVAGAYAGADFDGMIDLKVSVQRWLHPDGTVTLAHREGTTGSFVELLGDPIGPSARLVRFGADFVQTSRDISDEWREEILALFETISGRTINRDDYYSNRLPLHITREGEILRMVDSETDYVNDLMHRYTATHARVTA